MEQERLGSTLDRVAMTGDQGACLHRQSIHNKPGCPPTESAKSTGVDGSRLAVVSSLRKARLS